MDRLTAAEGRFDVLVEVVAEASSGRLSSDSFPWIPCDGNGIDIGEYIMMEMGGC